MRYILDPKLVVEFLECLANELRPIIVNNPSWYAKAIDHINELDHIRCFYLLKGIGSTHLEKESIMVKINQCLLVEDGLIEPTTSIPHILNSQEEVIGRRCPGAW